MKKILLLTDIVPCRATPAGLVLDQLCRFLPHGSIACFATENSDWGNPRLSSDLEWIPVEYHERLRETARRMLPGRAGVATALAVEQFNAQVLAPRMAARAVAFGRRHGAELLWCVLEGQTMIRLALPVAKALGIPLVSQVFDPPGWHLRHHKIDKYSRTRVLAQFDQTLRGSASCMAASWAMAEEYGRRYGVPTEPVVASFDPAIALPAAEGPNREGDFIIGMAGQIYATDEWKALIAALDSLGWRLAGRDVRIRLMGRTATIYAVNSMRVEFLGWRPQAEALSLMAESDLLYCPYWFSQAFETEARLSFPSKLATYLAAGRPVFFHGPEYASPGRFLAANDAGVLCHTLDPAAIASMLETIAGDAALYRHAAVNGSIAFQTSLTLPYMRRRFAAALGVDEAVLDGAEGEGSAAKAVPAPVVRAC